MDRLDTKSRHLNYQDYKILSLAALGGALEFYDFIIFVFFAPIISQLFFPPDSPDWLSQAQTFGIFAAGYLVRPLGGIIMAHFGDSKGRKKMFTLSILLMALPTLAMSLLPVYQTLGMLSPLLLLLMRMLQGAAIGGEAPGAWVFVAEHVPPRYTGFACGMLTAGLTVGILFGSLVATVITSSLTANQVLTIGWRIPFFLGGILGLVTMYLRRWLQETPVFQQMLASKRLSQTLPIKRILLEQKRAVIVSVLLTWLPSACIMVVILMAPTLMQKQYAFPLAVSLQANSIATIMLIAGCILYGIIVDRIGAGRTLLFGSLFLGGSCWLFFNVIASAPEYLFVAYGLAGLSVGVASIVPLVIVRSFPAPVRFTGISFSYNLSYAVFGGLTPVIITLFSKQIPMASAYYILGLSGLGVLLGLYLCQRKEGQ